MTTTTTTPAAVSGAAALQLVKLGLLEIAPENVRTPGDDDEIDGLAASIAAVGLIQPLAVYQRDGKFYVEEGGRRLRALKRLRKAKRLPAALREGVPVLVSAGPDKAADRSLAGNVVRRAMTPGEELAAYRRLFEAGRTEAEIAVTFAVSEKRVRQLLRLIAVAPSILERFMAGELGLEWVEACTVSDDHAAQVSALDHVRRNSWGQPHEVKNYLRRGSIFSSSMLGRFVGRDAYVAAGGRVSVDLFSGQDDADEQWLDGALLLQLAEARILPTVEAVSAEGWSSVRIADACDISRTPYALATLPVVDPTAELPTWEEAERAALIAYVGIGADGEIRVRRGLGAQATVNRLAFDRDRRKVEAAAMAEAEAQDGPALVGRAETPDDADVAVPDAPETGGRRVELDADDFDHATRPEPFTLRPEPSDDEPDPLAEREQARRRLVCARLGDPADGTADALALFYMARDAFGRNGFSADVEPADVADNLTDLAHAWSERLPEDDTALLATVLALEPAERDALRRVVARLFLGANPAETDLLADALAIALPDPTRCDLKPDLLGEDGSAAPAEAFDDEAELLPLAA